MKRLGISKNPPLNLYPLIMRWDQSDWMMIHRFQAQQTWQRAEGVFAKSKLLAKAVLWPVLTIRSALRKTKKFGKSIAEATGISKWRQRFEQIFLALFGGISPKSYYLFQLYLPANRYLHRYETKGEAALYRTISSGRSFGNRFLKEKDEFHRHCLKNGIPTAPVHMTIDVRSDRSDDNEPYLPHLDLFIKPAIGKGGKDTQMWAYRGDDVYENTAGQSLKGDALLRQLRRDAADGALLVQSRLENHPDLRDLCGSVFSTARIMTVLDEDLEPEVTTAVFRMANGSAVVDNIHCGGLAASIDLETGTLGSAQSLSPAAMRVDTHPSSNIEISGFRLPDWVRAKDLAIRAHKSVPENSMAVVGWDIGFAEEGPLLVEGNSAPCVHLLQRALGAPLGGTRFGELIAFHLARVQSADLPDQV